MFVLQCNILIGKYKFNYVNHVEIESSWQHGVATAKVIMPGLKKYLTAEINIGDEVQIWCGYKGYDMQLEFAGYINKIAPKKHFEIECEDEMWQLKRKMIKQSWRSIDLADLIKYIYPAADVTKCPKITFSPFSINSSAAKALQTLVDDYGIMVYFRPNKTLYAGLAYGDTNVSKVNLHLQKNVAENDLTYRSKDEVRIKIKAVSLLPNNTMKKVDAGDDDGEERTLHFYGIKSEAVLKQQANAMLESLKIEGYRGELKSFGIPFYQHGDTANIIDGVYPERGGEFNIDKVKVEFGMQGYRRTATIGKKLAQ